MKRENGEIVGVKKKALPSILLAGRQKNPFADPTARPNRYDSRWNNYFHNILRQECALPQ
jgi:hypothetical protein